ncbi:MAG: hypothetical protein LAP85_06645 [Acidobacteriia bacterium]|nr:hypothetical protein [Terriglobia bacterium]
MVDLTVEELLRTYPGELGDLEFAENQAELGFMLQKTGESVEAFFRDFPNTASKEQVRLERLRADGRIDDHIEQNFNYLLVVHPDKEGINYEESRTDSGGHPIRPARLRGYSSLSSGFAGTSVFFHPRYQSSSRFRYLGRQRSEPNYFAIAFAQRPETGICFGTFRVGERMLPIPLLYQGLAWVDPLTYQIVRLRTDLLAPRSDVGLTRQTSEIWLSEVRFTTVTKTFWLPREVLVTVSSLGQIFRNRHRYSDYQVFLVESHDKIEPPKVKKKPQ